MRRRQKNGLVFSSETLINLGSVILIVLGSLLGSIGQFQHAAASTQLHIGDTIAGALTDPDTPDQYVVFGAFGDLLSVGVFPDTPGAPSPSLEIDGPDGSVVASDNGSTESLV